MIILRTSGLETVTVTSSDLNGNPTYILTVTLSNISSKALLIPYVFTSVTISVIALPLILTVTVTVSSPLVLKMITGDIPQYYYIGSSLTSPLSPFTNESGKNPQSGSTIPAPDASPEQSVESGMENILLQ